MRGRTAMIRGTGSPRGTAALQRHFATPVDEVRASDQRFPDGAHFRIEIPSVENPAALRAVVEEARAHKTPIHRTSQGSGAMLLTRAELAEMAVIGADEGLEVNLFVGPREEYGIGGSVRSPEGMVLAGRLRGLDQLRYALEDILRAVDAGIRGFLIADSGLLQLVNAMVRDGELPTSIVWKISAVLAPSNPVSFKQLDRHGRHDGQRPQRHEPRSRWPRSAPRARAPIDLYLEAPDALGGMVRGNELAEIATVAAPLYAKFGLRNARMVYPAGEQNMSDVVANVREKVRRAALALEFLDASAVDLIDLQARRRRNRSPRAMTLRSDRWVRGDDEVALDSRVALKMGGASVDAAGGRPIIGLANSSSDLNPCNQPLADYIAPLREGIESGRRHRRRVPGDLTRRGPA